MKLESGEFRRQSPNAPCQTGSADARCRATKSSGSASQCVRDPDPALKPDLALDREPAN